MTYSHTATITTTLDYYDYINSNYFALDSGGTIDDLNSNAQADTLLLDLSDTTIWTDYATSGYSYGIYLYFGNNNSLNFGEAADVLTILLPENWSISGVEFTGSGYRIFDELGNEQSHYFLFYGATTDYDFDIKFASTPCFTRGTEIECENGDMRRIEDLRIGDTVMTKDKGPKKIGWIGSTKVTAETLRHFPERRPITFAAGALGNNRPLSVSPQHRILQDFGEGEVFVAAKHLVNDTTVLVDNTCEEVEYFHMMLDEHSIVNSNNAWTESFFPGKYATSSMDKELRNEILFYFPELGERGLDSYGDCARPPLTRKEIRVIEGNMY